MVISLVHDRYYGVFFTTWEQSEGPKSVIFKHKYTKTSGVILLNAIIQEAKDIEQSLCGNINPPLDKTDTAHIEQLTNIFDKTKATYNDHQQEVNKQKENQDTRSLKTCTLAQAPQNQQPYKNATTPFDKKEKKKTSKSWLAVASENVA